MAKARRYDWRKYWEQQDPDERNALWPEINKFWELDEDKQKYTLGKISSDVFRNKKSKWKSKHYSPYTTYEQRMNKKPQQLTTQEWADLVEFWDTPQQKVISERNKGNRGKQVATHTSGRISFPQLMNRMIEEQGAPPHLGEFYVSTHLSPNTNDTRDDQSRRNIEKMREIAGVDENGNQLPLTDEIYREVVPSRRRKRVRLIGPGTTQSEFGSQTSTSRLNELENELAEMRRIAHEKEEERQHEIDELKMQTQSQIRDMTMQFQSQTENLEARVLRRLMENMPFTSLLNTSLFGNAEPNSGTGFE